MIKLVFFLNNSVEGGFFTFKNARKVQNVKLIYLVKLTFYIYFSIW